MHWGDHYDDWQFNDTGNDSDRSNNAVLLRAGLVFAILAFLASLLPRELVCASLSSLLFIAGYAFALLALVHDDPILAERLTYWDVAAFFHGTSIALSWFVEPAAVQAALDAYYRLL